MRRPQFVSGDRQHLPMTPDRLAVLCSASPHIYRYPPESSRAIDHRPAPRRRGGGAGDDQPVGDGMWFIGVPSVRFHQRIISVRRPWRWHRLDVLKRATGAPSAWRRNDHGGSVGTSRRNSPVPHEADLSRAEHRSTFRRGAALRRSAQHYAARLRVAASRNSPPSHRRQPIATSLYSLSATFNSRQLGGERRPRQTRKWN